MKITFDINKINKTNTKNSPHLQNSKTKNTTISPFSFQGRFDSFVDSFRMPVALDVTNAKTSEIEEDFRELKYLSRQIKKTAKMEDRIKNISLYIAKQNDYKMYTTVDEEENEKVIFNGLDDPDKVTTMTRYSFKNGMKAQKFYEFYDDTFKNYKLKVPNSPLVPDIDDGEDFVVDYLFQDGKLTYYKNAALESREAFEITFSDDAIVHKEGLTDSQNNITFPTCLIVLSKNKDESQYVEYNEENDNYDVYKFDKTTKTWRKTSILDEI